MKDIKEIIERDKLVFGFVCLKEGLLTYLEQNENKCQLLRTYKNSFKEFMNGNKESIYFHNVVHKPDLVFTSFKLYYDLNKNDYEELNSYKTFEEYKLSKKIEL